MLSVDYVGKFLTTLGSSHLLPEMQNKSSRQHRIKIPETPTNPRLDSGRADRGPTGNPTIRSSHSSPPPPAPSVMDRVTTSPTPTTTTNFQGPRTLAKGSRTTVPVCLQRGMEPRGLQAP